MFVVTCMGKESKKLLSIYLYLNHFAIHLKIIKHCRSAILQCEKTVHFKHAALDDYSNTFSKATIPGSGVGGDLFQA